MDLYDQLRKLIDAFGAAHIPYALCGGLAMAVHRFPRATMDIDVMIEEASLSEAKRVAVGLGYSVDAGSMTLAKGQVKIYRVTMLDPEFGDVLPLDLLLVTPAVRKAWETRAAVEWEGGVLTVVSREGLVLLKELRGSGQDRDDIGRLQEGG